MAVTLTLAIPDTGVYFTDDANLGRQVRVFMDPDTDYNNANEIEVFSGGLPPGQGLNGDFSKDTITLSFSVATGLVSSGWYSVWVWIEDDDINPSGYLVDPGLANNGVIDFNQDLLYSVGNGEMSLPNIYFPEKGAVSWTVMITDFAINYPV